MNQFIIHCEVCGACSLLDINSSDIFFMILYILWLWNHPVAFFVDPYRHYPRCIEVIAYFRARLLGTFIGKRSSDGLTVEAVIDLVSLGSKDF